MPRFFRTLRLRLCLFPLLVFAGLPVQAQLVNIESKRMQTDSVRFALKADAQFNYSNQNGDTYYAIGSNLTTQFKSEDLKQIYFLMGNFNLVRAEGKDFQNSWFLHGRYNRKLSDLVRLEGFAQYQKNELLIIDSRFLLGAGVRLKVLSGEHVGAYLGNAVMYEIEQSSEYNQKDYQWRHSAYFSLNYSPEGNRISLTNTLYFQPLYEDFGNYRILEQFRVEMPVSKALSATGTFNYSLISVTPAGARDSTSNILFGLSYAFPPDL